MKDYPIVYAELGQQSTAQIDFKCAQYGGGYYISTNLILVGQGIRMSGDGSTNVQGKKTYHVTKKAFEKLQAKYSTAYMASL